MAESRSYRSYPNPDATLDGRDQIVAQLAANTVMIDAIAQRFDDGVKAICERMDAIGARMDEIAGTQKEQAATQISHTAQLTDLIGTRARQRSILKYGAGIAAAVAATLASAALILGLHLR